MNKLKLPEGEAIEHPWVSRAIENAQRKVEARNFDIRKQLLEYDDVSNDQRKVIYEQRNELLASDNIGDTISAMRHDVINTVIDTHIPRDSMEEQWDVAGAEKAIEVEFGSSIPIQQWLDADKTLDEKGLREKVCAEADAAYAAKEAIVGTEVLRHFEKAVMLQSVDSHWREHLAALDQLRQGIHLRGYAQKNPKQEYKREAFELFSAMLDAIKIEVTRITTTVQVRTEQDVEAVEQQEGPTNVQYRHADPDEALAQAAMPDAIPMAAAPDSGVPKVGRNDPCPCGSGKKYKHCHGRLS
jgi:preprotein translocase subunit SecA